MEKLELFALCSNCEKCGWDENIHSVKDLRVMPNGEWVCEGCFDNFNEDALLECGIDNPCAAIFSDMPKLPKIGIIEEQTNDKP